MKVYKIIILFSLLFFSCSDSSNSENFNDSYLEFNETRVSLKNGYFTTENLTNGFLIQLTDGTINNGVLDVENFSDDTSAGVSFYITDAKELVGNYSLVNNQLNTISSEINCIKINNSSFNCLNSFFIEGNTNSRNSGNVSISKSNETYTIDFNFVDENDSTIKGVFSGYLNEIGV